MKIFVTGADGFLGSHLTEKLLSIGHKVTALSYYNSFGFSGWLTEIKKNKNLKIVHGDIRDYNFIENVIKGHHIVFHLAALISIPHSYQSYKSYLETNVNGTSNILTKIAADQLSLSFFKSFDLPVVIIRPFNTFGPRQSTRAIIPTIITQSLHGKGIKLGNISTIRDFTYIKDTIDGFLKCIKNKNIIGETINVASGYEISIRDLIKIILSYIDPKSKILTDKKRFRPIKSEVNRLWGCNKKAKKILKWKPKYSGIKGFKKAIYETVEWYKKSKNLKKFDPSQFNI